MSRWQPPVRVIELELSEPVADLTLTASQEGLPYRQALALVRLHREPLGLLPLDLRDGALAAEELARAIWDRFRPEIDRHLAADGAPPARRLPVAGPADGEAPPCGFEHAIPGDPPLVSVVVTTCDRPFQLRQTLDSLLAQSYPAFEVIVVDNRPSSTITRDAVAERHGAEPRLRYLGEPRVGLSAARNAGLARARGALVAFTDDDVRVDRHWLSSLAVALLRDEAAVCATGLILPLELETTPQIWFEQFGGFGKGFRRRSFDLGPNRPPDVLFPYAAGRFGSGASSAFRTGVLRKLGGFSVELGRAPRPTAARTWMPIST